MVVTYFKAAWHHAHPDEPVLLYSELDEDRFEVRTVEEFRDGTRLRADAEHPDGETGLGQCAVPPDSEIESDPEFSVLTTTEGEFSRVFASARYSR